MGRSRATMMQAMLRSDADWNGRFITGVLSTGIFCLPSCRARKPRPENVRFFDDPAAATAAGLRPCRRCRPELFYRDRDPDRERLEEVVASVRDQPARYATAGDLTAAAGVGSSKLSELVRLHYHATPKELLARARNDHARDRLIATSAPVIDVAYDVGFESLSAFHAAFRRANLTSPLRYRQLRRSSAFRLDLPTWYRPARALSYLGRDPLAPSERVRGQQLQLAVRLGKHDAVLTVTFERGGGNCTANCTVQCANVDPVELAPAAHALALRVLGLHGDPRPFERRAKAAGHAALVRARLGLTVPQTRDLFEGFTWVVLGQQVSLPVAYAMRRKLIERFGRPVDADLTVHPDAASVAGSSVTELQGLGLSGRKAEYLLGIAQQVASGIWDDLPTQSATTATRRLLQVRGLGPWSVNYLLMRTLGFADCVPYGDVALQRSLMIYFQQPERPDTEQTRALLQPFVPFRSLAVFHLWADLQKEDKP